MKAMKKLTPFQIVWTVLAAVALAAVVTGHWWHIGSLSICGLMISASSEEEE